MNKQERIKELERLIKKYQHSYYNNEAEISDSEFDSLWDELNQLDQNNPILNKIGSDIIPDGFPKTVHIMPMGSQEKAANPQEFETWAKKQNFSSFLVEYKLDGASLELQYEKGLFTKGVTRGDGKIGDDITQNVLKMKGLIKDLGEPLTGAVRAEVIMSHEVHANHFSNKANCRNAANGLMKRKDGSGVEHLNIICYDAFFLENTPYTNEKEKLQWLKQKGFETSPATVCESAEQVNIYRALVMEKRKDLTYDIDGLVVKDIEIDYTDLQRNRPEKQIAYKFSLEEAVSIIRSINWNENGATYTPIAEFDKVELAGTSVQRASLNNPNMIRNLNLKIGSHVIITKRGEIIPKVESLVENPPEATPIDMPTQCTSCNTPLKDEGTRLFCPNSSCKKRILHRIEKWISVLDIRDFGELLIKRLFEQGKIASLVDLYLLTAKQLASLERMGEKSAAKVILSRDSKRNVRLSQFIAGFDIEGIGETLIEKIIQQGYTTLESFFSASKEDFSSVYGFAEITAVALVEGLAECKKEMLELQKYITIESNDGGTLSGKSFCFTGELSIKRSEAENLVKQKGGMVKTSITKDLSYLITNDIHSGSSKNVKAKNLSIPILDEKGFFELLS
ncbi:MAG: NAD-dependent DNA ligase LigA [Treponemataceae bacterium]